MKKVNNLWVVINKTNGELINVSKTRKYAREICYCNSFMNLEIVQFVPAELPAKKNKTIVDEMIDEIINDIFDEKRNLNNTY